MTDHQLQEQLLNAQLSAPAGVWEQIHAVLDTDAEDGAFQQNLNSTTLTPPVSAWAAIELELNQQQQDEQQAANLQEIQLQPPSFIWNRIEDALNETHEKQIATQLLNAEMKAPATAWAVIDKALHPGAKVIPMVKRFSTIYRYAAAAAVIGLIVWGGFQLLNPPTKEITVITPPPTVETPVKTESITKSTDSNTSVAPANTKEVNSDLIAYNQPKRRKATKTTADDIMTHDNPSETSADFSETNYLLVVDDKGDLIRVSKKLSTMDCAKNSNVPVDAVTALQAKDCENKIKKLQQMMATSVMGTVLDPNALNTVTEK